MSQWALLRVVFEGCSSLELPACSCAVVWGLKRSQSRATMSTEAAQQDAGQQPFKFSKYLAHTEKKIRDRGVNILSKWLQQRADISQEEMMRIWKALFYCKPLPCSVVLPTQTLQTV